MHNNRKSKTIIKKTILLHKRKRKFHSAVEKVRKNNENNENRWISQMNNQKNEMKRRKTVHEKSTYDRRQTLQCNNFSRHTFFWLFWLPPTSLNGTKSNEIFIQQRRILYVVNSWHPFIFVAYLDDLLLSWLLAVSGSTVFIRRYIFSQFVLFVWTFFCSISAEKLREKLKLNFIHYYYTLTILKNIFQVFNRILILQSLFASFRISIDVTISYQQSYISTQKG